MALNKEELEQRGGGQPPPFHLTKCSDFGNIIVMKTNWKECNPENWHYAANVFPLLPKDELDALAADIEKNGLLNPIIRCEGKILDGRNRILACQQAGVEPRFRDIVSSDALAWAMSQNLYRRHMLPTEQALTVHLLELKGGESCNVKGTERVRAYKKLALLKDAVSKLANELPETYAVQLRALLKQKHTVGNEDAPLFWKTLGNRLSALLPTGSDGGEHGMIELLQRLRTEELPANETCLVQSTVRQLKAIAVLYERYAQDLAKRHEQR